MSEVDLGQQQKLLNDYLSAMERTVKDLGNNNALVVQSVRARAAYLKTLTPEQKAEFEDITANNELADFRPLLEANQGHQGETVVMSSVEAPKRNIDPSEQQFLLDQFLSKTDDLVRGSSDDVEENTRIAREAKEAYRETLDEAGKAKFDRIINEEHRSQWAEKLGVAVSGDRVVAPSREEIKSPVPGQPPAPETSARASEAPPKAVVVADPEHDKLLDMATSGKQIKRGHSSLGEEGRLETNSLQNGLIAAGYISTDVDAPYNSSKGIKMSADGKAVLIHKDDLGNNQGELTLTATKNFQKAHGLPETGVADKATLAAVAAYNDPANKDLGTDAVWAKAVMVGGGVKDDVKPKDALAVANKYMPDTNKNFPDGLSVDDKKLVLEINGKGVEKEVEDPKFLPVLCARKDMVDIAIEEKKAKIKGIDEKETTSSLDIPEEARAAASAIGGRLSGTVAGVKDFNGDRVAYTSGAAVEEEQKGAGII